MRAQTTAWTARASKGGNSTAVQAEDVKGFGFAEWPDVRFTINRVNEGEARSLNVRGRLIEGNSLTIVYDKRTPIRFTLPLSRVRVSGRWPEPSLNFPVS